MMYAASVSIEDKERILMLCVDPAVALRFMSQLKNEFKEYLGKAPKYRIIPVIASVKRQGE